MCCCAKPNVNGEVGSYSWDGHRFSTRQPAPPPLQDGDVLLYDEPGRCGGIDCHSHHFRLVRARFDLVLLVRHGGGDERWGIGPTGRLLVPSLAALTSDARFWLFHTLYSTARDSEHAAAQERNAYWRQAAADGRIKTRKVRNAGKVRVWVDDPARAAASMGVGR